MKNTKINTHLKYLLDLSITSPPPIAQNSLTQFYILSKKYQIRICKEVKRNTCFKCYSILVPEKNCNAQIIKKENGVFLEIVCYCGNIKNFCFKGRKGLRKN